MWGFGIGWQIVGGLQQLGSKQTTTLARQPDPDRVLRDPTKQPRYLGDGTHSLGTSLPEHQLLVAVQVLGSFDEAEVDRSLVPRPQAVSVHGQDGGRLPYAAAVDWEDTGALVKLFWSYKPAT